MLGIDRNVLIRAPKRQILTAAIKNCEKSAVKHSIEKPYYLIPWICPQYLFQGC